MAIAITVIIILAITAFSFCSAAGNADRKERELFAKWERDHKVKNEEDEV